jgi:uncharacterized protein
LTLLDVNVLLYALDADSPQHSATMRWLDKLLETSEPVALSWITIWGFLRIATNPRAWPQPASVQDAFAFIDGWLRTPGVVTLNPGSRHSAILERIVLEYGVRGALVTDAVLAALAIEHGATLASCDRDFSRFTELKWINPVD